MGRTPRKIFTQNERLACLELNSKHELLKSALLADIEDAALCDLASTVMAQTVLALENNTLRAMDAIHIGSAMILKADVFVSADKRQ